MKIHSEQEMLTYGRQLGERLLASRPATADQASAASTVTARAIVLQLIGDVGAGKTTLTRGLATGLGITEPVTSPSFTISKRYTIPSGGELIHYDFYRLPDPGLMAEDLAEAVLGPQNIVVVEWGDALNLENSIEVSIKICYNYRYVETRLL